MTPPALRLGFAGTPEFAVPALRALIERTPHQILAVYTRPDRPAGRGRKLSPSPVKTLAIEHGIEVRQPVSARDAVLVAGIRELQLDLLIVVAYGMILPAAVLAAPRQGCINIHASLLPRWRGPAPIARAILAGDTEAGVTLMQIVEALDAGPMLSHHACPIRPDDTAGSLATRLSELGADALVHTLEQLQRGKLAATPQEEAGATYAAKLTKDEGRLDWNSSAEMLERAIRGYTPWPGAQVTLLGAPLRIWSAEVARAAGGTATPGTVLRADRAGIEVATGAGVLRLTRVQSPGRNAVPAWDFVNAHPELRSQR